jgi:hypothetical protein
MSRRKNILPGVVSCLVAGLISSPAAHAAPDIAPSKMTAEQIAQRNIAARGGVDAWRATQAISWSGQMEVGSADSTHRSERYVADSKLSARTKAKALLEAQGKPEGETVERAKQVQLPFTLTMERAHKMRLELAFAGKTALQIFDGTHGWKVRPYLNRNEVESFTPDEIRAESREDGMDGPLIDYAARGTKISSEGVEKIEGRDAYRLKLVKKDGSAQHVWIDAESFLDVKVEGTQRRMDGRLRDVWVYQRDFRSEHGLVIPHVLETAVDGYHVTHRTTIDKVSVNPKLDEAMFAKPVVPTTGVSNLVRKG